MKPLNLRNLNRLFRDNCFDKKTLRRYGFSVLHEQLLPTFKKKRGPKPKYGTVEQAKVIANRAYRKRLKEKGFNRMEVPMPEVLSSQIKTIGNDLGITGHEFVVEILQKVLAGQTVSLETLLASKPQTEIAPNRST